MTRSARWVLTLLAALGAGTCGTSGPESTPGAVSPDSYASRGPAEAEAPYNPALEATLRGTVVDQRVKSRLPL